jgi:hypothetical protein
MDLQPPLATYFQGTDARDVDCGVRLRRRRHSAQRGEGNRRSRGDPRLLAEADEDIQPAPKPESEYMAFMRERFAPRLDKAI